jgi:hypothetical protein
MSRLSRVTGGMSHPLPPTLAAKHLDRNRKVTDRKQPTEADSWHLRNCFGCFNFCSATCPCPISNVHFRTERKIRSVGCSSKICNDRPGKFGFRSTPYEKLTRFAWSRLKRQSRLNRRNFSRSIGVIDDESGEEKEPTCGSQPKLIGKRGPGIVPAHGLAAPSERDPSRKSHAPFERVPFSRDPTDEIVGLRRQIARRWALPGCPSRSRRFSGIMRSDL